MAENSDSRLEPDELIGRLVPDPSNPGLISVVGFGLGVSDRSAYWRLYIDRDLTEYLEFRKEDCLNGKERRDGHTIVWLKRDAKIAHTRTQEAAMLFVRGHIRGILPSTGFEAMQGGGGGGGGGLGGCTRNEQCCWFTLPRGGPA